MRGGGGRAGEGGCTRGGGREEGRGVGSSASTALAAAAKAAASGKRARKSVVLDGVSYRMPTFIYERGHGLKVRFIHSKLVDTQHDTHPLDEFPS